MPDPIPYGRQWISDEDIAAVAEVLRSDFLTTGPAVAAFESDLAARTGASHAVAVNSGTAALHAAYFAAGLGPGDEIVTSPLSFAATANAAIHLGAAVRFADVNPQTGCLDPESALAAIGPRTKLVVAVDFGGQPADYDGLAAAAERGVAIVADAAHSLGATYHERSVGTLAWATTLSFHPVKTITTGEGGAVLTEDEEAARRMARFRTHGVTRDRSEMSADEGPWFYEQIDLGFNYRMTDIQAALGSSQLRNLELFLHRRRAIAARYAEAFGNLGGLLLPTPAADIGSAWHLYPVRTSDSNARRPLFERLRAEGLGVQVHYIPIYWHPYYRELGYARGLCPNAEAFYAREISLPIFPRMSDSDVSRAIEVVTRAVRELAA